MSKLRVGQGWDFHRFAPGRRLVLGGVEIPYELGLIGHSDADVVLHALCDALLGAAGLNDIGHYFPNSDPRFKDANSLELLRESWRLAQGAGANEVGNIDITILAEAPRIAPHINEMKGHIRKVLGLYPDQIAIKATTTEQMGSVGRGEGIAASAVVLIYVHG